ncbi:tRNA-dihydrouridine synthase family protein [Candidatus Woesearchaeota archaeon]|nr:tRNA-dihydrouridine synthase family protein [Candidatus Woesearchaeota archaeon]
MKLKNPFVLAPMANYSDLAFRLLCRRCGASLAYTEQVSAIALSKENRKTLNMIKTCEEDSPISLQLSGRDKNILLDVIKKHEKNYDYIDLNFGCPSKKIVKCGYGSALLKEKEYIKELLEHLSSNMKKPLTVKMRSGFKQNESLELVKIMEDYVDAIAVHARTREQGYSGKADWGIIREIKENVSVPVIGNGDIESPEKAFEMLNLTKCDYVMIGRAAQGNPFIFEQCNDYFNEREYQKYDLKEKKGVFFEYHGLLKKFDLLNLGLFKGQALEFFKGYNGSKEIKTRIVTSKNTDEIIEIVKRF